MRKFTLAARIDATTNAYQHCGLLLRDLLTKTDFSDAEVEAVISLPPGGEFKLAAGAFVSRDAEPKSIRQEWDDKVARHRLVDDSTGEVTDWSPYVGFCYLNGMVGCTAYYLKQEAVLSPDAFCKAVGCGVDTGEARK